MGVAQGALENVSVSAFQVLIWDCGWVGKGISDLGEMCFYLFESALLAFPPAFSPLSLL